MARMRIFTKEGEEISLPVDLAENLTISLECERITKADIEQAISFEPWRMAIRRLRDLIA